MRTNKFNASTRLFYLLMITQHKISDIKYEIERISDDSPGSVTWINLLNVLSAILSIVLVPFTAGTSLLFLLGIPLYSAFASIATSNYRTAKLTAIQTRIMIDGLEPEDKK